MIENLMEKLWTRGWLWTGGWLCARYHHCQWFSIGQWADERIVTFICSKTENLRTSYNAERAHVTTENGHSTTNLCLGGLVMAESIALCCTAGKGQSRSCMTKSHSLARPWSQCMVQGGDMIPFSEVTPAQDEFPTNAYWPLGLWI